MRSQDFFAIVDNKSVVSILNNGGTPIPVLVEEINSIKRVLSAKVPVKSFPWLQEGTPVQVVAGPLTGITGVIERHGRKGRLYIAVESLGQTIVVEIDARDVRAI